MQFFVEWEIQNIQSISLQSLAFLIITIFVNHRVLYDLAAVGIVEKMICLLFLVPSSILQSVSSLSAINLGARKLERAHKIFSYAR